jgi:uncharacterized protein
MNIFILAAGFAFGSILIYANLNRYNVISGMATLENLTVAKAIATAIGAGAIFIALETGLGLATYHIKPFLLGGIALGGLIFGTGMAILGYCPGTLAVSLGEGSADTVPGIAGGLIGGLVFTAILPFIKNILGPDLGTYSLFTLTGQNKAVFYILVTFIGGGFILAAFVLNSKEKSKDFKWLYSGIALGILNVIIFLTVFTDRIIGASSAYPYVANILAGNTQNSYFLKIESAGKWELIFLTGAFLAGLIISLVKREFRITTIHSNWEKYKGKSVSKRFTWAFAGGFLIILGARMAGGCTSGHIISGGMQLSVSSLAFAVFVFAGLLITGRFFYLKKA